MLFHAMTQIRVRMTFNKKKTFIEFTKNDLEILNESDTNLDGPPLKRKYTTFNTF